MKAKKRGSKLTVLQWSSSLGKHKAIWRQDNIGFYSEIGFDIVASMSPAKARRLAEWILARIEQEER